MSVATIERRLASVAARLAPPTRPLEVPEMAERLRLALDPWQVEALESPASRLLINASRQAGKSTVAALRGLHEILSAPDRLVLVVSPTASGDDGWTVTMKSALFTPAAFVVTSPRPSEPAPLLVIV